VKAPIDEIIPLEKKEKGELLRYIDGLNALLSTNYLISSSFDLDLIFKVIIDQARQFINAEVCELYVLEQKKSELELKYSTNELVNFPKFKLNSEKGIVSKVVLSGRTINLSDVADEQGYLPEIDSGNLESVKTLLCVPLADDNDILGAVLFLNKQDENYFNREDVTLIDTYSGQLVRAIRYFSHIRQEIEQARIEKEIDFCAKMQRRILPKAVPELPEYGVSGSTHFCRKVGGDWFDFIKRDDGQVDFVIADVSGKGISAAFIVAMAHGVIHGLVQEDLTVDAMVTQLNRFLCTSLELGQFITLFYARLTPGTGTMTYVNAGHDAPFFFTDKDAEPEMLGATGKIIGLDFNAKFECKEITMNKGSLLVMLTDGFSETPNAEDEFFGDFLVEKIRPRLQSPKIKSIRKKIFYELFKFSGGAELRDDCTLLLINRP
jgi:sigma-B regulation protein RsbU (phosphoserine phosphatase)